MSSHDHAPGGAPASEPTEQASETAMLLVFLLDGESFGVIVDCVHEILDPPEATPVPNAGAFAVGVVNVRGVVVPVLDLRWRLGFPPAAPGDSTRIIVLEHPVAGTTTKLAFEADAVEEVIEVSLDRLERVPELGARWPQIYLKGALRNDDGLVFVLDTTTLFDPETKEAAA